MTKIKLLGSGKSEKHIHYTFPKKQAVFGIVRELLKELGEPYYEWNAFGRPRDKKWWESIYSEEEDVEGYTDRSFAFEGKDCYIEIVFGKERVFLMVHTEKDMQKKITKILSKFIKT
jgi:hypothetical protein